MQKRNIFAGDKNQIDKKNEIFYIEIKLCQQRNFQKLLQHFQNIILFVQYISTHL